MSVVFVLREELNGSVLVSVGIKALEEATGDVNEAVLEQQFYTFGGIAESKHLLHTVVVLSCFAAQTNRFTRMRF